MTDRPEPSGEAKRQKKYREARNARVARMETAISEALDLLKGNDKWLAIKLRAVLTKGLEA